MDEAAQENSNSVQVELHQIIIREMEHEQYIVLKEVDGVRRLPIMIDSSQAFAIDRRLKGEAAARPLTHDLLANVIEELGGVLTRIEITKLDYVPGHGGTYYATIHIKQGENTVVIDARPSDAIALGVAKTVPIFVSQKVMAEAEV